ncbi:MAG: hypothetical protein J6C32_00775 [Eubacterium sp.]|nr:hypothetical protein [Eubacterium sp.]
MSKIDGYSVYQSPYFDKTLKNGRNAAKTQNEKTGQAEKAAKKESVELSEGAKELLKELQKKYGDMDFFVADYSSAEEAQSYLSRGTKAYSVLIDPETLEAMAADEDTKQQYIDQIDAARTDLNGMQEKLKETGEEVTRVGMTFDKDGNVSYFAEVEKISEKYKEHIEKGIEKRKEEKAEAARKEDAAMAHTPGKVKKTTVYADSVDELLKKIREVDWDKIDAEEVKESGGLFDFSI